jgi:hypothetical protein
LKNRSLFSQSLRAQIFCGFLIAAATIGLTACGPYYYKFPQYTFANRPIPPSKLANRVMVSVTTDGTSGSLQILDGLRDIRSNVENTIKSFSITGYSSGYPDLILNFPEQVAGYVYSNSDGSIALINYGKESSSPGGTFSAKSTSLAIPPNFAHLYSAQETIGQLGIIDHTNGGTYGLVMPNIDYVVANQGDTIVLMMLRNSNNIYRLIKLNTNMYATADLATAATGAADCEPFNLPVYCAVPVAGTYDHPVYTYFSLDGTTAYVLNCGPECGGTTASVSILNTGSLNVNTIPNVASPLPSPVLSNIPVPGGATVALANGTTLYVAGQQLLPDGLFTGFLTTINLASAITSPATAVTGQYSISDGNHSKLLFADNNTLWVGSQHCATGERAKLNVNYNCLTRFDLGSNAVQIVPTVTPGGTPTVPYPNTNQNAYYYGDLTGLCWVQNLNKVYTAYGGQVHAFNTADGSEINNTNIIVQGTALDTAYMDAVTNADN